MSFDGKKSAIKEYNMELRSFVLHLALSIEDLSTLIIKSLLRKVKPDSKTLDNKSSSLSLKNKIDILYDIGDIKKEDYNKLLKFMEIRNQFIHNPQCNTFIDLETFSPTLTKFLANNFENNLLDKEDSFVESFKKLHLDSLVVLTILFGEYRDGEQEEVNRFMNSLLIDDIAGILENCEKIWLQMKQSDLTNNEQHEDEFKLFHNSFKIAFDKKVSELAEEYESNFPDDHVFSRKKDMFQKKSK